MKEFKYDYIHAGYPGKDAMRENAIQQFGGEMKGFDKNIGMRGSFSAPSRTQMRLYKKGGYVDGGSLTNMHMPKKMGFGKSHTSDLHVEKGYPMKKGGQMSSKKNCYSHGGHEMKVYANGGSVYEREMNGVKSHRGNNYESDMRGEHPRHMRAKLAAGGVAKMRHGEANSSGKPIMKNGACKMRVY